jgi:hypothetical protein
MEFDINSGEWFIANLAMVGLGGKDVTNANENDASHILAMGFHDDEERIFIIIYLKIFSFPSK